MSVIAGYFEKIATTFKGGQATEHSYRPALYDLFSALDDRTSVTNEPKKVSAGAPDFVFMRGDVPVGHCEAKDVGIDLKALKGYSVEQKQRYREAFPNLLYTNGLDFEFYREGELIRSISIGEILMGLQPKPLAFDALEAQLKDFVAQTPRTITSSKRLAELMAAKAVLIKNEMGDALVADLERNADTDLTAQYRAFQEHLIHDITAADFADIYAETIAYGLFAARLHDQTLDTFSRQEALELLPKSNPFLRRLFGYIAGPDLDKRLAWIIDDLTKIFLACNLNEIMADFGKLTGQNDPFLHFYETFLAAYNPAKRKARGVWYTPEPVVNFIVRAVDEVLKSEFGLADGLADTSKIRIDFDTGQTDKKGKAITEKRDVHRVQILDPATGTGTFLAEVIKQIGKRVKASAPGHWSSYVESELIPRIHGFELLMASYAMCHMKLDMILTEMGYKPSGEPPRLSVYLTNSLEEGERVEQVLFARWLAEEAREASKIKRDMPIMCVIGNPPYSGISQNMGPWISGLIEDYKYVDGQHFGERKHWLHDDYVKFIRFAEHMIGKNGEGVLGFITNHGYLDNPTFRGMRWHLLNTFDAIYVLDLHGNAKKKEVSPDGSADKNVFDIQQGVAILIAVKKKTQAGKSKPLAKVFHGDLWGMRSGKYDALTKLGLKSEVFQEVCPNEPLYLMGRRDHALDAVYNKGFGIQELMFESVTGVQTSRDHLVVDFETSALAARLREFFDNEISDAGVRARFFPGKENSKHPAGDTRGWRLPEVRKAMTADDAVNSIVSYCYRPLDARKIAYSPKLVDWPRTKVMRNFLGENVGLAIGRQGQVVGTMQWNLAFVHDAISDLNLFYRGGGMSFPLYLYPEEGSLDQTRRVNFDPKIWRRLRELAKDEAHGEPDEIAVFDYIYGVLHSPDYRETFAEFLKTDFPRIPYPASPDIFWHVSEKGGALRRLHLMEPAAIGETPYSFMGEGDGVVEKPGFDAGSVWINKDQRFEGVPEIAWNFYIGGYQPAQKWLKDRKGRPLSFADIQHYQRIIKILSETHRIMGGIELPVEG
ncbi:type ISP restriction/modification enzyme [Glycocaulis sp.]|uniref:type ISP restriction/modification enzyme n=1 Tax=Glycocaulis sp. TaxID=1969725 RepID=UPI003D1C7D1B